jgi:predicted nucleic acid-binding protein
VGDAVFLDTVGLVALLNRDDALHDAAAVAFAELERSTRFLVTTSLVLGEVGNCLARTALREDVAWLVRALRREPRATIVHPDDAGFESAVELFCSRADKQWGLVDCFSFVVMQAHGAEEALTADRHFRQAGFRTMLAQSGG